MDRDYQIFECQKDGSVLWCAGAAGLQNARLKMTELLRVTGKEYFALDLTTRRIVFAVDVATSVPEPITKRIFQICYSNDLRLTRSELLRSRGYAVISAVGNEAAKALLTTLSRDELGIALFIIGHAATAQTKEEMVGWLRQNYPKAKILVLNPPNQEITGADYNVLQNGPESWLPLVETTMKPQHAS
jgi:hypothetical protein